MWVFLMAVLRERCLWLQPIQLLSYSLEVAKPGKIPAGKTEIPFEVPLRPKANKELYETYHGVFVNIQVRVTWSTHRTHSTKYTPHDTRWKIHATIHTVKYTTYCKIVVNIQVRVTWSTHSTKYTPHDTRWKIHATIHTVKYTTYCKIVVNIQVRVTWSTHSTKYTPHDTRWKIHATIHTVKYTTYCKIVVNIQVRVTWSTHSTKYTPHDTRWKIHATKYKPQYTPRKTHFKSHTNTDSARLIHMNLFGYWNSYGSTSTHGKIDCK